MPPSRSDAASAANGVQQLLVLNKSTSGKMVFVGLLIGWIAYDLWLYWTRDLGLVARCLIGLAVVVVLLAAWDPVIEAGRRAATWFVDWLDTIECARPLVALLFANALSRNITEHLVVATIGTTVPAATTPSKKVKKIEVTTSDHCMVVSNSNKKVSLSLLPPPPPSTHARQVDLTR